MQYGAGTVSPQHDGEGMGTMSAVPEFEFVSAAACRDARVNNCPQVALNVPGVVALRDSERPDTIVTMTADQWVTLAAAVKAGEFNLSAE